MFEVSSLPDGKSKDLLTMKQDKEEWMEYDQVMEHVVEKSGLDKSIFYDLRGNHDNFGVPAVGGPLDYFSNYSLNGKQGRNGLVNSVTIQVCVIMVFILYIFSHHGSNNNVLQSMVIFIGIAVAIYLTIGFLLRQSPTN